MGFCCAGTEGGTNQAAGGSASHSLSPGKQVHGLLPQGILPSTHAASPLLSSGFHPSTAPSFFCCFPVFLFSAYKKEEKTYLALQEIALKTKRNR